MTTQQEGFVLDTPAQINAAVILSIRSSLRLEVNGNGMRFSHRVSPLKQAQALGLTTAKTKTKALEDLNVICDQLTGKSK